MEEAERCMQRAIQLAAKGLGYVAPNPLLGAVIAHQGRIIGEGYHKRFGGPHAEVHALQAVEDPSLLPESTLYLSMEPCCHYGKTPPCTDLILKSRIRRVVVATRDPFPSVAGNGVQVLRAAGIEVLEGLLEAEARWMNRRFLSLYERRRPYVILKWAQTADGYMARSDYSSKWISGESSRSRVHEWRAQEAAILVGPRTAILDNPFLTARPDASSKDLTSPAMSLPAMSSPAVRQPLRVVLDPKGKLPRSSNVLNDTAETLVVSKKIERREKFPPHLSFADIDWSQKVPEQVLQLLASRRISSVIVEGGARTLADFIQSDLWDEARVFESPAQFTEGLPAPRISEVSEEDVSRLKEQLGEDTLTTYVSRSNPYYVHKTSPADQSHLAALVSGHSPDQIGSRPADPAALGRA